MNMFEKTLMGVKNYVEYVYGKRKHYVNHKMLPARMSWGWHKTHAGEYFSISVVNGEKDVVVNFPVEEAQRLANFINEHVNQKVK